MQSFLEVSFWNGLPNKEKGGKIQKEQRNAASNKNQGSVKYSGLIISVLYRGSASKI
jgi:hypothetical protein